MCVEPFFNYRFPFVVYLPCCCCCLIVDAVVTCCCSSFVFVRLLSFRRFVCLFALFVCVCLQSWPILLC